METGAEWRAFEAAARRPERVERLAYRAPGTMSVPAQAAEAAVDPSPAPPAPEMAARIAELEGRLREAERLAAARVEQARREGREAAERARLEAERDGRAAAEAGAARIGAALEGFRAERDEYFAKVEHEVVRLALAIAARVLNREATLDPLLLSGAVRVALGQLGETTGVRLRCPPGQAEGWRETLRLLPNPPWTPEVVPDPALGPGECALETQVGTVDLGMRAQLAEIERGFFDLLEQRPGQGPRGARNPDLAGG